MTLLLFSLLLEWNCTHCIGFWQRWFWIHMSNVIMDPRNQPCSSGQPAVLRGLYVQTLQHNFFHTHHATPPLTFTMFTPFSDRLVGLVITAFASRAEDPACTRIFQGSSHTSDLKIGTPGAWRYRVSAGTGWPDVSILWLGEMESLICSFYLNVAGRKIVWADPSLRYTRMLLGR